VSITIAFRVSRSLNLLGHEKQPRDNSIDLSPLRISYVLSRLKN
jgi:hypothetical protein